MSMGSQTLLLEESVKAGMQAGELDIAMVIEIAKGIGQFDVYQIRAAYARAACACLGEMCANIDETPDLRPDAERLVEQYKQAFLADL